MNELFGLKAERGIAPVKGTSLQHFFIFAALSLLLVPQEGQSRAKEGGIHKKGIDSEQGFFFFFSSGPVAFPRNVLCVAPSQRALAEDEAARNHLLSMNNIELL